MLKEKVFVNRSVSIDYQTLYNRAKDYFQRRGVEISFDFQTVNYPNLSYRIAQLPQGQRVFVQPTMSQVIPLDSTYDISSFVFNGRDFPPPNIPTGLCYPLTKGVFIDILTDELNPPDLDYVMICHEHMHALTYMANKAGFNVKDVMDIDSLGRFYYNNDSPESVDSNFGEQWALLTPYIKSLTTVNMPPISPIPPTTPNLPQVMIKRQWDNGVEFLGDLYGINGFACKTLELPWKLNTQNISCIPVGTYKVKWTFSLRFLRYTYEVQNVPNRSGIRFHPGNFFYDLKGCIALGDSYGDLNHDSWADLINSRITIQKFETLMNKQDFILSIV